MGFETDTGKYKIGTGSATWTALPYAKSGAAVDYSELTGVPSSFAPSAHASSHGSAGSDAITVAQSQVTNLTTDLSGKVEKVNGTVTTASTSSTVVRNITLSTSAPSGGMDGDVWLRYV
jgi:hypothetical protein